MTRLGFARFLRITERTWRSSAAVWANAGAASMQASIRALNCAILSLTGSACRYGLGSLGIRRQLSLRATPIPWRVGLSVFPSPERFQSAGESERRIADIKSAFRRAIRLAGIKPITFHQLRPMFCSRLADAGIPFPVIQDLAGHASIIMTRRYSHPRSDLKQRP